VEGVRPAAPEDVAALARLLEAARGAAGERRGGPELLATCHETDGGAAELVRSWRDDARRLLLAGLFGDVVVGVAAGHVAARPPGLLGVVDCCYVEPAARGVGVGSALAEALMEWFVEQGCVAVDALALPGDRGTKQLYEALGFTARLLVLHRRLP